MTAIARMGYLVGILVLPLIVVEQIFATDSWLSQRVAVAAAVMALLSGTWPAITPFLGLQITTFALFIALGVGYGRWINHHIVLTEITIALEALVVAPLIMALARRVATPADFARNTARMLALIAGAGAAAGIHKFWLLTQGVRIPRWFSGSEYPPGTALQMDYNVFGIGLLVGLACALWLATRPETRLFERILAVIVSLGIATAVLGTGSRRGLVLALALAVWAVITSPRTMRLRVASVSAAALGIIVFVAVRFAALGGLPLLQRALGVRNTAILTESRAPYLTFTWDWLANETSPVAFVFGRGFSYLDVMANQFNNGYGIDYPHNMILSAMLHGGLSLVLLLTAVLIFTATQLRRYRAEAGPFLQVFVLGTVFAMTSYASFYSIELLVFVSLLAASLSPSADAESARPASVLTSQAVSSTSTPAAQT